MAKHTITIKVKNAKLLMAELDRMRARLLGKEPDATIVDAVAFDVFPALTAVSMWGRMWHCECGYSMPEKLSSCVKCGAKRKDENG